MTHDQFVNKYYGQQLTNNNGNYLGECVSLAARYAQEVQGVPNADGVLYCPVTGGARDLYEQFPSNGRPNYYDQIPYGQSPKVGDLVVWGANMGRYGDVAVYNGSGQVFGQLGTPVFIPAAARQMTPPQPLGYLRRKGGSDVSTVGDNEIDQMSWAYFGYGAGPDFITEHRGTESNTFERFMYNHPVAVAYRQQVADWRKAAESGGGGKYKPYSGKPLFEEV